MNYLYNGVELPDINTVWTEELKAEYPYAHIIYYNSHDIYTLRYHTEPISYTADLHGYFGISGEAVPGMVGLGGYVAYDAKDNSWEYYTKNDESDGKNYGVSLSASRLVWSSHDVPNIDDDSVYLAASDPIPVYE